MTRLIKVLVVGVIALSTPPVDAASSCDISLDVTNNATSITFTGSGPAGKPAGLAVVLNQPHFFFTEAFSTSGGFQQVFPLDPNIDGQTVSFQLWAGCGHSDVETITLNLQDGSGDSDVIDAQFSVSRPNGGVAPLAIHFDASMTQTDATSRPFHELDYHWDFGDDENESFDTTGRSKNTTTGPLAAHVYDEPGTYVVMLTVRDQYGNWEEYTDRVTVHDPDDVFADSTVCLSTGSISDSDCPVGTKLPNLAPSSLQSVIQTQISEGKRRVLIAAGTSWTTTDRIKINPNGPGLIGAFGLNNSPGSRPIIDCNNNDEKSSCIEIGVDNWRIIDLHVDATSSPSTVIDGDNDGPKQILVKNCHLEGGGGEAFDFYWNDSLGVPSDQLAFFENTIRKDSSYTSSDARAGTIYATRAMIVGNDVYSEAKAHAFRFGYASDYVFSNNDVFGGKKDGAVIKLHAPEFSESSPYSYSEKVVLTHNILQAHKARWMLTFGPANDYTDARVRDIIWDGNLIMPGEDTTILLRTSGEDVTIRNNIFEFSGGLENIKAINVAVRGDEPKPEDVQVYNNTIYRADQGTEAAISIGSGSKDVVVRNNLVSFPSSSEGTFLADAGSSTQASNNLLYSPANPGECVDVHGGNSCMDPQFVSEGVDFRLQPSSPAIDNGSSVPVLRDFDFLEGKLRPQGAGIDIGAFEQ